MAPNDHRNLPFPTILLMNAFSVRLERIPRNILIAISKLFDAGLRCSSRFTLYEMIRSSHNFEDVKVALNERTNWSIELASIPLNISPTY